jgi:hypothetical protein
VVHLNQRDYDCTVYNLAHGTAAHVQRIQEFVERAIPGLGSNVLAGIVPVYSPRITGFHLHIPSSHRPGAFHSSGPFELGQINVCSRLLVRYYLLWFTVHPLLADRKTPAVVDKPARYSKQELQQASKRENEQHLLAGWT